MFNRMLSVPLILLTGCATIVNGTTQQIAISSNPASARIFVDKLFLGYTPSVVTLARSENHIVQIELDGYEPYQMIFLKEVSNWVWGNILFGGFIGLAVDAITGGIYRLTPEQLCAEMRQESLCFNPDIHTQVRVVLQADPSWEKIGSLQLAAH